MSFTGKNRTKATKTSRNAQKERLCVICIHTAFGRLVVFPSSNMKWYKFSAYTRLIHDDDALFCTFVDWEVPQKFWNAHFISFIHRFCVHFRHSEEGKKIDRQVWNDWRTDKQCQHKMKNKQGKKMVFTERNRMQNRSFDWRKLATDERTNENLLNHHRKAEIKLLKKPGATCIAMEHSLNENTDEIFYPHIIYRRHAYREW